MDFGTFIEISNGSPRYFIKPPIIFVYLASVRGFLSAYWEMKLLAKATDGG